MIAPASVSAQRTPGFVYVQIPVPLLYDLYHTPLAIGLYALIARRYAIHGEPVPLSASDVLHYDPSLKYGAVVRGLTRLAARGWVVELTSPGRKSRYVPTWGCISGQARPWQMDAPRLGRPRHVHTRRVDVRLLDTYMGKLVPHPTHKALITRYLSQPLLSLSDVGAYALTLADIPCPSATLTRYQLLCAGQAQPLPDDAAILAQASQHILADPEGPAITAPGLRKLGCVPAMPNAVEPRAQSLFFVPRELIGSLVGPPIAGLVGGLIDSTAREEVTFLSSESSEPARGGLVPGIPCIESNTTNACTPTGSGGGSTGALQKQAQESLPPALPDTETVQLLQSLNIHPHVIIELADQPVARVRSAALDARTRSGIRNPAGWAVACLRAARDYGWSLLSAPPQADACTLHQEHLSAAATLAPALSPADSAPVVSDCAFHADAGLGLVEATDDWHTTARPAPAAPPSGDLSALVHPELRCRLPHTFWPLIDSLAVVCTEAQVVLSCDQVSDCIAVETTLRPLIGPVFASLGWTLPQTVQVITRRTSGAAPDLPPADDGRPDWIAPHVWAALPGMARIALRGATRRGDQVCGATPALDHLLQTRFAAVVAPLVCIAPG